METVIGSEGYRNQCLTNDETVGSIASINDHRPRNAAIQVPSSYVQACYTDADEHGHGLRGWELEYSQMSAGPFSGTLAQFHLNNMQLFRERTDCVLLKRGASWPGSMILSLPVAADGWGWSGGHKLPLAYGLLADGNAPPEILTPNTLDVICVAFDRRWFALRAVEQGYAELAHRVWHQTGLTLPPARFAKVRAFFVDMFDELKRHPEIVSSPVGRAALEASVLSTLLDALSTASHADLCDETPQKRVADLARAYAMKNAFDKPSVEELCRRAGVSRRHLQNCFLQSYGQSALHLLKAMRLNGVRRELKRHAAEQAPASIGDIAANWGFWHWSRFSGEYRDFFGELPSDTLRRN